MAVDVTENPEQERYEITVDGELAGFAEYRGGGATRALTHTEIFEQFGGRGLAKQLIRTVLDENRASGRHVLPICPFVKAFMAENPGYTDLVEPKQRRAFNLPDPPA